MYWVTCTLLCPLIFDFFRSNYATECANPQSLQCAYVINILNQFIYLYNDPSTMTNAIETSIRKRGNNLFYMDEVKNGKYAKMKLNIFGEV